MGNPARIVGYSNSQRDRGPDVSIAPDEPGVRDLGVGGAFLRRYGVFKDIRGALSVGNIPADIPFVPARWFLVYDVPGAEVRGEHAHRQCEQFLLCVHGSVRVLVDDGRRRVEVVLDQPSLGLYLPPRVWGSQFQYSPGTTLLVFASRPYEADDYIRTYEAFLAECGPRDDGSAPAPVDR
ncbi:MAG: WxcM-like domain-containing protein [Myxococcales bacterium]|nr:MAG: WxcM-like domain-containing protein [Myxococcales bacterium]